VEGKDINQIQNNTEIMVNFLKYIINLLTIFINYIKKIEKYFTIGKLTLVRTTENTLGRNKTFILSNDNLLEKKDLFYQIFNFLITNDDFLSFGEYKIIIVSGKNKKDTFNLHHNILIKNDTTFENY